MHKNNHLLLTIGNKIRILRKSKKLTILNLASLCNISEKHLGQIERGKSNLTLDILEKIAHVLELEPYMLLIDNTNEIDKENFIRVTNIKNKEQIEVYKSIWNIVELADSKQLQRIYRVIIACQD